MNSIALSNLHNALAPHPGRPSTKFIRQEMYIISAPRGNLTQSLQAFYYHHRTKTSTPACPSLGSNTPANYLLFS